MSKTQVEPRATGEWSHCKALNILGRNYSKANQKHITRRKEAKINILTTYHADDNISVIIKALGIDM